MKKKITIAIVILLLGGVVILLFGPSDKKGKTVGVITFIDHPVLNTINNSFRDELTKNIEDLHEINFLNSNARGRVEDLPSISRSLIRRKPYVIVTISTPVSQALMRETDAVQRVVYTFVTNPADLGDELTRTNSTGLSDAVNYAANVDLIIKIFGESVKIGMLYNPNETNSVHGIRSTESLIDKLKLNVRLIKATVLKEADIPTVTSRLATQVDAIYVGGDNTVVGAMPAVVNEALRKGVPVFASDEGSIELGAVAGVSVDYAKLGVETAKVVKRVLDGTEPKDIPRITLKGDKLILNKTSAARWKLDFPEEVLNKADRIISN